MSGAKNTEEEESPPILMGAFSKKKKKKRPSIVVMVVVVVARAFVCVCVVDGLSARECFNGFPLSRLQCLCVC